MGMNSILVYSSLELSLLNMMTLDIHTKITSIAIYLHWNDNFVCQMLQSGWLLCDACTIFKCIYL